MEQDRTVEQLRRGQLAGRIREETADILDKEERKIINSVMTILNANETLEPQFAIQQWLALASVRAFRRTLTQRERQVESAGRKMASSLTKP